MSELESSRVHQAVAAHLYQSSGGALPEDVVKNAFAAELTDGVELQQCAGKSDQGEKHTFEGDSRDTTVDENKVLAEREQSAQLGRLLLAHRKPHVYGSLGRGER